MPSSARDPLVALLALGSHARVGTDQDRQSCGDTVPCSISVKFDDSGGRPVTGARALLKNLLHRELHPMMPRPRGKPMSCGSSQAEMPKKRSLVSPR
jgi:hypothetical protein